MCKLASVHGPKAKRKFFCWTKKFEKLLFEVLPDEAVDDKVDGGVEHERQLVDRGDCQPKLPAVKKFKKKGYQKSHTLCFVLLIFKVFMAPVVKVQVVDALVDYSGSVADEKDCYDAKQNLRCLWIFVVEASTDLIDSC